MLQNTRDNSMNESLLNSESADFINSTEPKNAKRCIYCFVVIIYLGSSFMTYYLGKSIGELSCDGSV